MPGFLGASSGGRGGGGTVGARIPGLGVSGPGGGALGGPYHMGGGGGGSNTEHGTIYIYIYVFVLNFVVVVSVFKEKKHVQRFWGCEGRFAAVRKTERKKPKLVLSQFAEGPWRK